VNGIQLKILNMFFELQLGPLRNNSLKLIAFIKSLDFTGSGKAVGMIR
jgi:hypothetical protein